MVSPCKIQGVGESPDAPQFHVLSFEILLRGRSMCRNILIFSDGTGQVGGYEFDEDRTNVYKLYRATRVAPDSCINPKDQAAFYDPGLGSRRRKPGFLVTRITRWRDLDEDCRKRRQPRSGVGTPPRRFSNGQARSIAMIGCGRVEKLRVGTMTSPPVRAS
jgi:Uncharacterized alpha/beta hydrolase domain (DUF2235)